MKVPRETKSRVTVSLSSDLVEKLDKVVAENGAGSRSELVEGILRDWWRQRRLEELDREFIDYYNSLTEEERKEDEQWAEAAWRDLGEVWKEEE